MPMEVRTGAGSANIAVELRRDILEGEYAFGQRLPSERSLAKHFGAARSTVRKALRQLEESDLVSRRIGSGTYVSYRGEEDREDVARATSPLELIDVRIAVEPQITRLALASAGARDLDRLEAALAEVEAADNPADFSRADEAFHLRLAECTRNPLLIWLYRHINEIRGHAQWHGTRDKILTPLRIREYNAQHRKLTEAIRRRDVEAAIHVITEHLEKARRDLMGTEF